jgi:hypothetical protein
MENELTPVKRKAGAKRKADKKELWVLRLDPELKVRIKSMKRKAAPWVRDLIWEALHKQEDNNG